MLGDTIRNLWLWYQHQLLGAIWVIKSVWSSKIIEYLHGRTNLNELCQVSAFLQTCPKTTLKIVEKCSSGPLFSKIVCFDFEQVFPHKANTLLIFTFCRLLTKVIWPFAARHDPFTKLSHKFSHSGYIITGSDWLLYI